MHHWGTRSHSIVRNWQKPKHFQARLKTSSKCNNPQEKGIYGIWFSTGHPQGTCTEQCANCYELFQQKFSKSHPAHLFNKYNLPILFKEALKGRVSSRIFFFSSGSQMLGTSPEFSKLLMSSKNDSFTIYVSVNKKVHSLPSTPVKSFNVFINSLKLWIPYPFTISIFLF